MNYFHHTGILILVTYLYVDLIAFWYRVTTKKTAVSAVYFLFLSIFPVCLNMVMKLLQNLSSRKSHYGEREHTQTLCAFACALACVCAYSSGCIPVYCTAHDYRIPIT